MESSLSRYYVSQIEYFINIETKLNKINKKTRLGKPKYYLLI